MDFDLIIVGCASLDTIHVEKNNARITFETVGGAGLYTALAAAASGARVVLFAPKPKSMPDQLKVVQEKLSWFGPECDAEELPRLEIVHHGGGSATLLNASWGTESLLQAADLPNLSGVRFAHVAALSSVQAQESFVTRLRDYDQLKISVGTYARLVYQNTDHVLALLNQSDFFFMNANEYRGLFPHGVDENHKSKTKLFVTDAENGVTIYSASEVIHVKAPEIVELDPTGAGDTFCGTVLAQILQGKSYKVAAELGCQLASRNVASQGPAVLLDG